MVGKKVVTRGDKSINVVQRKLDQIFAKNQLEVTSVVGLKEEASLSFFVTRTRLSSARELRKRIKKGTKQDNRWAKVISQLEAAQEKEI